MITDLGIHEFPTHTEGPLFWYQDDLTFDVVLVKPEESGNLIS